MLPYAWIDVLLLIFRWHIVTLCVFIFSSIDFNCRPLQSLLRGATIHLVPLTSASLSTQSFIHVPLLVGIGSATLLDVTVSVCLSNNCKCTNTRQGKYWQIEMFAVAYTNTAGIRTFRHVALIAGYVLSFSCKLENCISLSALLMVYWNIFRFLLCAFFVANLFPFSYWLSLHLII